jgi:DNA-binding CsgD family transcriptional regulator
MKSNLKQKQTGEETMWTNALVMNEAGMGNRLSNGMRSLQERKDAVTQILSIISIVVQSAGIAFRRSEAEGEQVIRTLCELSQQALSELRSWPPESESLAPTHGIFQSGVIKETFSHTISRTLHLGSQPDRATPRLVEKLTPREEDMLRLIVMGLSNKEIAAKLHLTEGTVKGYISHLLAKLNVRSRTQAALVAVEHGLV